MITLLLTLALTTPVTGTGSAVSGKANPGEKPTLVPNRTYSDFETALVNASDEAMILNNLETGESIVIEPGEHSDILPRGNGSTEPEIPEGVEIAIPPADGISPFQIIDGDTRKEITNVNAYPYCAIAYLEFYDGAGSPKIGTAVFVGERTLLTAAHNLVTEEGKSYDITVYPGGKYSSFPSAKASSTVVSAKWVSSSYSVGEDYGVIIIPENLGTGCFGSRALANSGLGGAGIRAYGYPGDKIYGRLWYGDGVASLHNSDIFLIDADAVEGQSGGPVVAKNDLLYIIGLISCEYQPNKANNYATRVTEAVVAMDRNNS